PKRCGAHPCALCPRSDRKTLLSIPRLDAAWEIDRQAWRPSTSPILSRGPKQQARYNAAVRHDKRGTSRQTWRDLMRKVTLTLAIALLFAGSAVLTADAQTSRGAKKIAGAAPNFTPLEPAACL